jgi:hypothetical protein
VASLRPLLHGGGGPPSADDVARDTRAGAPLLLVAFAAWIAYLVRAPDPERLFWIAATLGLLASVPFVYGDAGFRGLAAAYPFLAAALAIGLQRRPPARAPMRTQRSLVRGAAALTIALLAVALVGPACARAVTRRPPPDLLRQADAGAVVMAPAESPTVVVSARPAGVSRVPRIERRDLLRMLAWAGLEPEQEAHLAGARPPFAVLSAYDYGGRREALLIAPVEMLREGSALLSVQVRAVAGSAFLEVVGWRRLDEPGAQRHEATPAPESEPEG